MKRYDDWPERLAAFLAERENLPFEWGKRDCALFACDAVCEMTGQDLAADFRGRYTDAASALRAIRDYCGGGLNDLAEKMAAEGGIQKIAPLLAQRGDVVLFDTDEHGETLGVIDLSGQFAVSTGIRGLTRVPVSSLKRAWRIG